MSNNLQMTTRRFSIKQLKPETLYELRVRANNAAGSSEYTYSFETIPSSLRQNGERLGSGSSLDGAGGGRGGEEGRGDGTDTGAMIIVPVVIGILVVVLCVGIGVVYVRKSKSVTKLRKANFFTDLFCLNFFRVAFAEGCLSPV